MANVLILEDEWLIADDHAGVLRDAGLKVVGPCPSVASAMTAIEKNHVDAALLDIELKNERSYAVADALRTLSIPFAFVTGYGQPDLPQHMHGQAILPKPLEPDMLLAAVRRLLEGRPGGTQPRP